MLLVPLDSSIFDTVTGLPVHPLVVHFAVVLLPLAALAQIVLVFVQRWRGRFATLTLAGLAVGTAASFVAKESGERLADHLGTPASHAFWGDVLPPVAAVLLVVAGVWWYLQRRDARAGGTSAGGSLPVLVTGLLSVVLAVAATIMTIIVGHSGAQAAWGGRIDTAAEAAPAASAQPSAAASKAPSASANQLTLAAVQQHATASSCWSIVNGSVYDLTSWISAHPGGPQAVKSMCGKDATAQFSAQHGSKGRPNSTLATFKLGALSS